MEFSITRSQPSRTFYIIVTSATHKMLFVKVTDEIMPRQDEKKSASSVDISFRLVDTFFDLPYHLSTLLVMKKCAENRNRCIFFSPNIEYK